MGQATLGAKTGGVEHELMTRLHLQTSNTPEVKVPRITANYKDLLLTTTASGGGGRRRSGGSEQQLSGGGELRGEVETLEKGHGRRERF